jgi:hypothetical protein
MKKKFLIGLIALLSVSLFFLGCPTEGDDDPPPAAEPTINVTDDYPLAAGQSNDLTVTALQGQTTGTVFITVTTPENPLTGQNDLSGGGSIWDPKGSNAPAGKWTGIAFDFSTVFTNASTNYYAVRQENQALRYYKGYGDIITDAPPSAPVAITTRNIYITDDATPVKWKLYNKNDFNDGIIDLILWSNAASRTITLTIADYGTDNTIYTSGPVTSSSTHVARIVIDYSGVTIQ